MSAFRGSSGSFFFICTHFGDNGNDFWAHRTNSELQLLRCSFLKLQVFKRFKLSGGSLPVHVGLRVSAKSGVEHNLKVIRYAQRVVSGVGGRGRSPIESADPRSGVRGC